ncbi:MAG: 4Fe-4S dicluster domain-containing protein [Chloroflexi bacterium]|nr:4Fe-4S dicluster domain-containing protein [Chloroflexota bacterium]
MTTVPTPTPAAPPFSGFAAGDAPGFDILNTCVQCGLCLPTCPTYRETYREQSSPRGRLHLMRAVHDGRIDVLDRVFTEQMYECLDCRACEPACPSGVAYGKVLEASRSQIERARAERQDRSLPERALRKLVFGWLFREPGRVRAVSALARAYQRGGVQRLARGSGVLRALRLDRLEGQLPRISGTFFAAEGQVYPATGERRGRVGLLAGCVMHTAYANVHRATVRVLTRDGWDVAVPREQGCCGALHVHAGETAGGRDLMRRNIAAFEAAGVDLVVNNAAGCGAAMKEYGHLLQDDPAWAARATAFSAKVRDVTEILATAPLRGDLRALNLTVTYQDSAASPMSRCDTSSK